MSINNEIKELFRQYQEKFTDFDDVVITDVNQSGLGEDKLLHLAARHNNLDDVKLLIQHGANINARGDIGLTPLHYAASKGNFEIVKMLIKYGANKNIQDEFGDLAVDWAKNNEHFEIIEYIDQQ